MSVIYGFALLGATFLLLGYGTIVLRRPHPPQWTNRFMVVETFGVVLTAMVSTGIALLVKFSVQFDGALMYAAGIGSLAGTAVLFAAVWRALGVNRKLAAYAAQAAAVPGVVASAANKGRPDDPASSGRPTRAA